MNRPTWLAPTLYPFEPDTMRVDAGRLRYIDEGSGPPLVLLHGNPTWSFMYRDWIRRLASDYRCIAPDYIGFGLSDKPAGWTYRPRDHAAHIETLIQRLGLRDVTLVLHDWGGPIGLSYATRHPDNVRRFVVMNTWGWPINHDPRMTAFSRLLGGALGRALITQYNAFARLVMPLAFADRSRLSAAIHKHYMRPLDTPAARYGSWVFPRALRSARDWLSAVWAQRHALRSKPALLAWGMKDLAFRTRYLDRWDRFFSNVTTHRLFDVGHYVPEEGSQQVLPRVEQFLASAS